MGRNLINPINSPRPVSYYSHGLRIGPILYSSGQTARNHDGKLVGIENVSIQAIQAFSNLMNVIKEAGMKPCDVVRLNIFFRRRSDLQDILMVLEQFFPNHRPALTTCIVENLAFPEYLLEVEAIAICD